MEPDVKPHNLIDLSKPQAALNEVLESIDEDFKWLEEILIVCKNTFSTATVNLLPKTPSQKKPQRNRARRRLTEDFEELEAVSENVPAMPEPAAAGPETPVRRLRSTRSRKAQTSTSTRVTRASKALGNKKEEKENTAPKVKENCSKTVKVVLPSVTEPPGRVTSPKTSSTSLTSSDSSKEKEKACVRDRARAYETMLAERNQGSPVTPQSASRSTPKSDGKETPESTGKGKPKNAGKETQPASQTEPKPAPCDDDDSDIIDTSQHSRRSSRLHGKSSKRTSLKVIGSKARLRSLQGRFSITGPCAAYALQTALETESTVQPESLVKQGDTMDPEEQEPKATTETVKEPLKTEENAANSRAPRTRLRLNKSNKSASDSSDSVSESTVETEWKQEKTVSSPEDPEPKPTRTKRKKQKSFSSEDEAPEPKMMKDSAHIDTESEVRTRTRTKARNMETTAPEHTEESLSQSNDLQAEDKTRNSSESVSSHTEGRTRTRTRARNLESEETTSSNALSAEDTMDTEDMEGSVFKSPTDVSKVDKLPTKFSREDSGIDRSTKPAGDNGQEIASVSSVPTDSLTEVSTKAATQKVEGSRRETHVISRTEVVSEKEEEDRPCRSTRTKTRQEQNKNKENAVIVNPPEQEVEEPRVTRTKTRKRKAEEEAAHMSDSKRSCTDTPPKANDAKDEDRAHEADSDSDYEDIEPDPPQVKKPVPSFLHQLRKSSLSHTASLVSGTITSFIKRNTPPRRPSFRHIQEQKKKELQQKEKRDQERLNRLDAAKKNRAEEQKRKREERMRKVAEIREMRQKKEETLKKNFAEKLQERLNSTEKMKEDKYREERERQRQRLKRQLEIDEKRKQEEDQRLRKMIEQEEEQKRQKELLQRKKEQEEQERQRRQAEERKRQEERQAELERQWQTEQEKLLLQKLERERERQKEKELKEKAAAQERAERARQELEKRKERELKIQRELEKLKELELQRQAKMSAQDDEKRREEARLQQIIQQHNRNLQSLGINSTLTLTTTSTANTSVNGPPALNPPSSKVQPNPDSYPISPKRRKKNGSMETYDINDLKSDDSTDDDEHPRKKIPTWAQGANLKAMLINQEYHPPDLDAVFGFIAPPNLNDMFEAKRARFNKRTSSAVWNSPIFKPR